MYTGGAWSIAYEYGDRKMFGELRSDIGAIREVLILSFRKTRSSLPRNRTVKPGDAIESTAFKPEFKTVK
jgi:hypothetical protein